MEMDMVIQAISTLGFPIFCCLYLFWHDNKLNDQHKDEIEKLTDIINNNTVALTKLTDRIEGIENNINSKIDNEDK